MTTSVRLCGAVPVYSALARCVLLVSFSQECRRHDCQKSSELSSAESRHDLEVRSWISRMQRLSACAQGAKSSDSNASMSAFGWLHQEGGAGEWGAVSRGAGGSKHVQGRSASGSGYAVCTLDRRARVEHHSASRGGIACHAVRGEGSASGGSFSRACRVLLLRRASSVRGQDWDAPS